MNIGILLYFASFIVAIILYYHILRCIYIKEKVGWDKYEITEKDIRLTHPLWAIILFTIILFVPVLNLFVFVAYLARRLVYYDNANRNPYYCKSIFTKEF